LRAVVQRAARGRVTAEGRLTGEIARGVVVLLGISPDDGPVEVDWLVDKVVNLRIFNDADGKMNLSLLDIGGEVLLVSQFTLYGDARKGRRPSFVHAAQGPDAERLYEAAIAGFRARQVTVETGEFGAQMQVELVNDGPVTILLDSGKLF
jgi:D-aminoacyl-tRNA deacylase